VAPSLLEIQTSSPLGYSVHSSGVEPILVVAMSSVAEGLRSIINEMTYATDFKLVNMFCENNANFTRNDQYTKNTEPESRWNIHRVSYDTLTCIVRPSSNGHLLYSSWSFGVFDKSHQYKTKNTVKWKIMITFRIEFKLQVTAVPGFHLLCNRCYKSISIFSDTTNDPENHTAIEQDGAVTLTSAAKYLIHAIWMDDNEHQQGATYWIIQIANLWMMWNRSKPNLANANHFIRLPKQNVHLIHLEWTVAGEVQLKTFGK